MFKKVMHIFVLVAVLAGLITATPATPAAADEKGVSPEAFLNPDGTLNLHAGFNGALDLEGWTVKIDDQRGPVFSPESAPAALAPNGEWANVGGWSGPLVNEANAIAISGSNVYIGGRFLNAGGISEADYIARWDGSNWHALGSNGAGNGSLNGAVFSLAVSGSNVYAGGQFFNTNNNGTALFNANYIAKWDGSNWSGLGSGISGGSALNSVVYAIAVNGTDVYAGGLFTNVANNGSTIAEADYVAKFDGTNWSALGGSGNGALNLTVQALAVDGSNNVYVGGAFTNASGIAEADYLAKWNGVNWSALGSNGAGDGSLNSSVFSIAISGSDVFIGGTFSNVNNNGTSLTAADYIAKWDGANWSALGSNGSGNGSLDRVVYAIAVSGTDLYIAGEFSNVRNGASTLIAADGIAKWDGTNWSALGSNGSGNGFVSGGFSIYGLAVSGSNIYIAGQFLDPVNNGTTLPLVDYAAKFDGTNWSGLGSTLNGTFRTPIYALAVEPNNLYAGGNFFNSSNMGVNNLAMDGIGKWDGSNWASLGNNSSAINGTVLTIAIQGTDVYVGGTFSNAGGIAQADYVAKWDGSAWSALGSNGSGNGSITNTVQSIAILGSNIYIGGNFVDVNNNGTSLPSADYIAKWDGTNWSSLSSVDSLNGELNGVVYTIVVNNSDIYVGGAFSNVSNNNAPLTEADYIVKWNGTNWSALGSNGSGNGALNHNVYAIAVNGSSVYAGGFFTNVNNNGNVLADADYIAQWDGTNWVQMGNNGGSGVLNNLVEALAFDGTNLYVGGWFTNAAGIPAADYIAKWNGTNWSALGSNGSNNGSLNGIVNALSIQGDDLYVGGEFDNVNNNGTVLPTADHIAAFGINGSLPTSATFGDVPMNHPYWADIEILYANGYTAGCSTSAPLLFCPETTMNRAQSAVFMVRGNFGTSYSPPAAPWTTFGDDFSPGPWAQPWAQGMFDAGLTAGCSNSPKLFCPWEEMPRFQAAVFGMRLREGINYPPPTGTGTVFADIDGSEWYAGWVEQAYLNGLLPACGSSSGSPLFCPNDLVPRGLAAYMIVRAKNLTMP